MKRLTYLKSFPATVLCLLNLIFALITFAILFRTVFFFGTFIGTVIRAFQFQDFTMVQKLLGDTLTSSGITDQIDQLTGGATVTYIFGLPHMILSSILVLLTALVFPVLNILNGIGSLNLRFRSKSSRMIQVIHTIYSVFNILAIFFILFIAVYLFISQGVLEALRSANSGNFVILFISTIVVLLILLIAEFIVFCYHKDVAQNMSFITSDLKGVTDYLDGNHLSGLSFIIGLILLIPTGLLGYSLSFGYNTSTVILLVYMSLITLKYFMVSFANGNLKKTVKARSRRNRR